VVATKTRAQDRAAEVSCVGRAKQKRSGQMDMKHKNSLKYMRDDQRQMGLLCK
jgi:hypothetical protein